MPSFLFLSLLTGILLLPGYAVTKAPFFTRLELPKGGRFLISLLVSYSIYIFIFIIKDKFHYSWTTFDVIIYVALLLSIIVLLYSLFKFSERHVKVKSKELVGLIIVLLTVMIYHGFVGAYDELPADIYEHLGRYQKALTDQRLDLLTYTSLGLSDLVMQKSNIWYKLIAQCSRISEVSTEQVIYLTTMVTKGLFALSIYSFSLCIFSQKKNKVLISLIATLFVFLHMGINVMAYTRYYSFAPTILAYCIYLGAIVCFITLLEKKKLKQGIILVLLILLSIFSSANIHTQEALFIIVMTLSISFVVMIRRMLVYLRGVKQKVTPEFLAQNCVKSPSRLGEGLSFLYVLSACIGLLAIYFYAQNNLERAPNIAWRLWEFNFFGWEFRTLNMKNQFLQVVTLWGVSVYIFSLIYFHHIKQNTFILAGLISPVLCLTNPFFVDVFLSIQNSTVLWRMAYLVPVHFAAALLLVSLIEKFNAGKKELVSLAPLLLFGVLLLAFLMPIHNTKHNLHYSRVPTLLKTDVNMGIDRYSDLISMLNGINEKTELLTDPVTGYAITALTKHTSKRRKFFATGIVEINYDSYEESPLLKQAGKLIVVNQRESHPSEVGRLSAHWGENVLNTAAYYKETLLSHLDSNPQSFKLIWKSESNDIKVYSIRM